MSYNTDDLKKYYASNKHSSSVDWPDFHRRAKRRQKLALNQLQEDELNDCLNLSVNNFRAKYRTRQTVVYVDGKQIILDALYEQISTNEVAYPCFRLRSLRLKELQQLTHSNLLKAATLKQPEWMTHFGGGRRQPFTYTGNLYPKLKDRVFNSFTSFLVTAGFKEKIELITDRRKQGWDIDRSITEPVYRPDGRGSIYIIAGPRPEHRYVGLTEMAEAEQKLIQHIQGAHSDIESSRPVRIAINTIGQTNFSIKIIEDNIPSDKLGDRERHWISEKNTRVPNGLNATAGGERGGRLNPTTFMGENFHSIAEAGRDYGREHGYEPYTVERCIRSGKPLPAKQRKVSYDLDAGTHFFRCWKSLINDTNAGRRAGTVCHRWKEYRNFKADMFDGYAKDLKLFRIDKGKEWSKRNSEWVTSTRCVEKTHGKQLVIFDEVFHSYKAASIVHDISVSTLKYRILKKRMTPEQAVTTPLGSTSPKHKK
jgi:hypothetical protein